MEAVKLVVEILVKVLPELVEFIQGEISGGADAEELRKKPLSVSVAFGGGPGKVIVVQESIEADMADPSVE
jgi:hypothetical protein